MAKKVVVIFIEGDTEVEFYKELVKIIREYNGGKLDCCVEIGNASGIGNYKRKVVGIFEKRIKPKYPSDTQFYVALCYDRDVFELEKNPPVNWSDVKKAFQKQGAKKVFEIRAKNAIEDWFLCDIEGVTNYLSIPRSTKIPKGSGFKRLQELFKKSNKLYIKGASSNGLVQALNIKKILSIICDEIKPLCNLLGATCDDNTKCRVLCASNKKNKTTG